MLEILLEIMKMVYSIFVKNLYLLLIQVQFSDKPITRETWQKEHDINHYHYFPVVNSQIPIF